VGGGLLAAAGALWLGFALRGHGIFWPDEIYQALEPAHRLAFGYGLQAWEFQLGARSWIFPGVLAGVMRAAAAAGVTSGAGLVAWAKVFMVLVAMGGLCASMRIARALAGPRAALMAGVLVMAFPPHLVFAGRTMSETATAAMLAVATWFVVEPTRRRLRVAGALVALATLLRPPNALVAAGLLALVAVRRRGEARPFLEGALLAGVPGGALDWVTWGAPFHAMGLYVRYNLIEGHAADYGTAPWWYYLHTLWTSTGPAVVVLAAAVAYARREARGVSLVALGFCLVHVLLPHKELRFLAPVTPLLLVVAATGLDRAAERLRALGGAPARAVPPVLAGALGLAMVWRAPGLTHGEMGYRGKASQEASPVGHPSDDYNRLLLEAHHRPDLCGLAVAGTHVIWLGGSSYLHRHVPLFDLDPPDERGSPAANYVLAPAAWSRPRQGIEVARHGAAVLYRYDRRCQPPPAGYDRFERPARASAE
jgi:hypothetical protein